ncbi:putative fusarubin cluster-esterase [Paramyrothecium foliicola]|nr:putative fusarubin cluster-esterase [Paramyrothecium foliicola]
MSIPEEPSVRSYFYVGGSYSKDDSGEHVFRDQMYVERLFPINGITKEVPVVLIHGQAMTGTNFLNKPDGGRGWASDFIRQGYEVYIVDQVLRGRSAWHPKAPKANYFSAERIQQRFTATKSYGLWPQAINHTQWPGSGIMGDEIFDAFYSSNVQFIDDPVPQQMAVQKAGAALLDRIGKPVILVGHSQGGVMPVLIADARPELTKALVLLEPLGPPFRNAIFGNSSTRAWGLSDIPLGYHPPVSESTELTQRVYPATEEHMVDCVLQAEIPSHGNLSIS